MVFYLFTFQLSVYTFFAMFLCGSACVLANGGLSFAFVALKDTGCMCLCVCVRRPGHVYKCQRHVFSMPHLSANTPAAINYAKSQFRCPSSRPSCCQVKIIRGVSGYVYGLVYGCSFGYWLGAFRIEEHSHRKNLLIYWNTHQKSWQYKFSKNKKKKLLSER